LRCVG